MKVGIYAGTFNPFHIGHLNIYDKALQIFDMVVVCRGINPEKPLVNDPLPSIVGLNTLEYGGLTTDLLKRYIDEKHEPTLIRGIRNGYDYDYEMNQITVMRDIMPSLQVVLIPCDKEFSHISSTMIRNLQIFDKKLAAKYLPK